jgi:hypothetical protein
MAGQRSNQLNYVPNSHNQRNLSDCSTSEWIYSFFWAFFWAAAAIAIMRSMVGCS